MFDPLINSTSMFNFLFFFSPGSCSSSASFGSALSESVHTHTHTASDVDKSNKLRTAALIDFRGVLSLWFSFPPSLDFVVVVVAVTSRFFRFFFYHFDFIFSRIPQPPVTSIASFPNFSFLKKFNSFPLRNVVQHSWNAVSKFRNSAIFSSHYANSNVQKVQKSVK